MSARSSSPGSSFAVRELAQEKEQEGRLHFPRASGGEQPGGHSVDKGAGFPMTGLDTVAQVLQRLPEQEHAGRDEFLVGPLSASFRQQQLDQPEGSLRARLQQARGRERVITGLSRSDVLGDELGQLRQVIALHQAATSLLQNTLARCLDILVIEPGSATL